MALATLSIDLIAQLARFEADLGKAVRLSEKAAAGIKTGFQGVGEVFAGSFLADFAAEAVRQLAALPTVIIESIAGFKDLEDKTGASAESLARWQAVAELSGTSMESIGEASVKLTASLSKIGDGGNIAGQALRAIGISLEDFRRLKPDEQLAAVAQGLAKFEDGAGKSAVAVALLGKSGAEMLPFLKDLAEAGTLQSALTQEQIERVDEYTKRQARLRAELKGVAQVVVAEGLPAFTAFSEAGKEALKQFIGLDDATGKLDPKKVADFADNAGRALAFVADSADGVVRVFQLAGTFIGGAAAAAALAISGEFKAASAVGEQVKADLQAILERPLFSSKFEEQLKRMRAAVDDAAGGSGTKLPALSFRFDADAEKKAKDTAKAYEDLVGEIRKRTSATEAELDASEKLTSGQQFALDIVSKLANAEAGYSDQMKRSITTMLETYLTRDRLLVQQRESERLNQAATRATAQQLMQAQEMVQELRDQAEEYGKTEVEVEQLRLARVAHSVAMAEEKLQVMELFGATQDEIEQQRLLVEALQQSLAVRRQRAAQNAALNQDPTAGATEAIKDFGKEAANAGKLARAATFNTIRSLEDDLTQSLMTGKLNIKNTIDYMIQESLRLSVVKPLLTNLFGANGEKAGSFFGSLFSPGGGVISAIGSLFGFADGGAFNAGKVVPFAAGGVFDSPHIFKFAQGGAMQTGVLGEAGPEAILPLRRGAGGKLGVVASGGGRSIVLAPTIQISIDARTDQAVVQQMVDRGVQSGMGAVMQRLSDEGVRP